MKKAKYNDRYTRSQKDKQVIKAESSDLEKYYYHSYGDSRQERRLRERRISKFSRRVYRFINKHWWDSISLRDRENIYSSWMSNQTWKNSITHIKTQEDFEKWIHKEIKKVTPDMSIYRDKVIDNILKKK